MAVEEKWYFSKDQLLTNSPSRRCGCSADKELSYRQQAANFIQDMGQKLQVTQLCINTAIVYMHRFYVFHSFTQFHRNAIAAAALFLAAKVEEQPRKLEHVIKVAHMCLHRDHRDIPPLDTKSEQYLEQAQDLVFNENVLLQTLGFDVAIDHPHTHVVRCCELVRASKDLAQTSYFMASNRFLSVEGKKWFWYVDKTVTMDQLERLTSEFLIIFDKCPTKLKRKIMSIKKESAPFPPMQNPNNNLFADPRKTHVPEGQEGSSSAHHHPLQLPEKLAYGSTPEDAFKKSQQVQSANALRQAEYAQQQHSLPPHQRLDARDYREKKDRERLEREKLAQSQLPVSLPSSRDGGHHGGAALQNLHHKAVPPKVGAPASHHRPPGSMVSMSRDAARREQAQMREASKRDNIPRDMFSSRVKHEPVDPMRMKHEPVDPMARVKHDQVDPVRVKHDQIDSVRVKHESVDLMRVKLDPIDPMSEVSGSQQNHMGNVISGVSSSSAGRNEWPSDSEVRDERHCILPSDKRSGGQSSDVLRHGKVSNEHSRINPILGDRYKDNMHSNTYNHHQDHIRHRSEQYHTSSQVNSDSTDRKPPSELSNLVDRKSALDMINMGDRKQSLDLVNMDRKPQSELSNVDRKQLEVNIVGDRKSEMNSIADRKQQSDLSSVADRHESSKRLQTNVHASHHVPTTKREPEIEENVDMKPRAISNSIPSNKQKPRSGSPVVAQQYGQGSSSSHRSKSPAVSVPPPRTSSSSQSHHHHSGSIRNGPVSEEPRLKRPEQSLPITPKLEHVKIENDSTASQVTIPQPQPSKSSTPVGHKGLSNPDKQPHSVRESPYPQRSSKSRQRTPPSSSRRPPLLETPSLPVVSSGGGLTSPFGSPPPPLPTTPGKSSATNNPSSNLRTTRHRSSSSSSEPELIPVVTKLDDIVGYKNIIHDAKLGIKLPGKVPDIIQPIRDRKKDESVHGINSKTALVTSLAKELKPDLIRPFANQGEMIESQPGEVGPVNFSPSSVDVDVQESSSKQSVDLNASLESVIDVTSITEPLPTLPPVDESAPSAAQTGSVSPSKKLVDHHHRSDKKKKKEKHKHKEKDKSRDKDDKDRKHKHKHKDKDKDKIKTDRSVDVMPAAEPIKITIPKDKLVNLTPTLEQSSSGSSGIKLKIQKERLKDLPQTTSNLSQSSSSAGGLKIKITGITSSSESSRKRERSSPGDESSVVPTKSARLSSGEHSKRSSSSSHSHSKQNGVEGQQAPSSRGRGSSQYSGNKVMQKLADLQNKGKSSSSSQP